MKMEIEHGHYFENHGSNESVLLNHFGLRVGILMSKVSGAKRNLH